MLVLDTSAALAALLARDAPTRLVELLSEDGDLHAPHLIDVEVLHALRRLVKTRAVALDRAIDARTDFAELALTRYPHLELSDRMWDLRHNLTAYAAAFVALAETLGVPLATCDARLASAPHDAHVQLFAT